MNDDRKPVLGRAVEYPEHYAPDVLEAIPRAAQRAQLGLDDELPFHGADLWTAWELSWLDTRGKPQVAVAQLEIPCDSPAIVESKSLKLYLNGFYQARFASSAEVQQRIATDLGDRLGAAVQVRLLPPSAWIAAVAQPPGASLDEQEVECHHYHPAPELLVCRGDDIVQRCWHSHLLRSLCPVTGQPDWATLCIDWQGPDLDTAALLRYIVSFRQHQDFHEQCVERIFLDLWRGFSPQYLSVTARYLRRGGIDINPVRRSDRGACPDMRLFRQ